MVHRHGRNHCRQVDERRGCPDIDPAYVPGTVWGTASNETARFERGAVPVLCEGQALTAPSTTASRRVPSPRVDTSSHRSAAIAPASSAAASARLIAGFTRIHAAIDTEPRQHEFCRLAVVIENAVARDEGGEDCIAGIADVSGKTAALIVAPQAVGSEKPPGPFRQAQY